MSRYVGKHEGRPGKTRTEAALSKTDGKGSAVCVTEHEPGSGFEAAEAHYAAGKKGGTGRRSGGRITGFRRFLLIYSGVFLVLIAVGLAFFWKYIAAFEVSRPEKTMDELIQSINEENRAVTLRRLLQVSEFEDRNAVFNDIYRAYIRNGECSYRKLTGEYTDEAPVYVLRAGMTDLFRVVLTPRTDEDAGYGFRLWDVSDMRLLEKNTLTVTIEAPSDAAVTVNGVAVPESRITDGDIPYADDVGRFNAGAHKVLYTISGLYQTPARVSATDAGGGKLTAENSEVNVYVYDPVVITEKIIAPSGAEVTLNGTALGQQDAAGKLLSPELFKGLEKYADSVPDFTVYEAGGLLGRPEIEAKDATGRALTAHEGADGTYTFGLSEDERLQQEQTGTVTDFIKKYVSFSSNEGNDPNGNFYRLSKCVLAGTDTYKRFADSVEGMEWVVGGAVTYNELSADDFISCGDDCFVCSVSMDIMVNVSGSARETKSACTLVFVRSGGAWLVGNMVSQ